MQRDRPSRQDRAYIEAGKFTVEDLQSPEFGGGKLSARAHRETSRTRSGTKIVDKAGRGLDCELFHASMIAKPGMLDFGKLDGVTADTTAEELAALIASPEKLTVEALTASAVVEVAPLDEYQKALRELATRKPKLNGRDTEIALKKIAKDHDVGLKIVRDDYKRAGFVQVVEVPGQIDGVGLITAMSLDEYAKRYAIVNISGRSALIDLHKADFSKAIMSEESFELAHREPVSRYLRRRESRRSTRGKNS